MGYWMYWKRGSPDFYPFLDHNYIYFSSLHSESFVGGHLGVKHTSVSASLGIKYTSMSDFLIWSISLSILTLCNLACFRIINAHIHRNHVQSMIFMCRFGLNRYDNFTIFHCNRDYEEQICSSLYLIMLKNYLMLM